jgi:hypothetical protein
MDAHNQKEEEKNYKKKPRYMDLFLATTTLNTTKTTPEVQFLHKRRL